LFFFGKSFTIWPALFVLSRPRYNFRPRKSAKSLNYFSKNKPIEIISHSENYFQPYCYFGAGTAQ